MWKVIYLTKNIVANLLALLTIVSKSFGDWGGEPRLSVKIELSQKPCVWIWCKSHKRCLEMWESYFDWDEGVRIFSHIWKLFSDFRLKYLKIFTETNHARNNLITPRGVLIDSQPTLYKVLRISNFSIFGDLDF